MNQVYLVAGIRALITATVTGGLAFLAVWSATDEVKVLVIAGLTPFLTVLGARLGVEGTLDSRRYNQEERRQ